MNSSIRTSVFVPDGKDGRPQPVAGCKAIFGLFIDHGNGYMSLTASTLDDFLALREGFKAALVDINKAIELELEY
jgi:hypothetical protein